MSRINKMSSPGCACLIGGSQCQGYQQLHQHAKALETLLRECASKLESQVMRNPELPKSYYTVIDEAFNALTHQEKTNE